MKKSALAPVAGLAAIRGPRFAFADERPPPARSTFNIGAVSDYRYRGIYADEVEPALQGGADYAKGPFYAGTWLSTIQWVKDTGKIAGADSGNAPVEWDLYGGMKGDVIKDSLTYDVGVLAYVYLGEKFHDIGLSNPDTGEFYGALTYGVFTGKVSIAATPLFGVPKSKGSQYYDLSANFDLGSGFTLTPRRRLPEHPGLRRQGRRPLVRRLLADAGQGLRQGTVGLAAGHRHRRRQERLLHLVRQVHRPHRRRRRREVRVLIAA